MYHPINNFNPDLQAAHKLYRKQIKQFMRTWWFLFISSFITLLFTFIFAQKDITKVLSLILIIAEALYLVTCAWIFDFGAAKRLRKTNFKIKGIANLTQGHTFYYALKKVGLVRVFLNILMLALPLTFGLLCFV